MPRAREREPRGDRRVPSRPVDLEKEEKKKHHCQAFLRMYFLA